jgi:tripeptidyl-peptidase-1
MGAISLQDKAGSEAMLDVCTVVAATYPLTSTVYNLGDRMTQGDIFSLAFQQFIKADSHSRPKVLSVSYGDSESYHSQAEAEELCSNAQKLTAMGTTIVFASGDVGVASIYPCPRFSPTYPSGCPFITSVGGTQRFDPEEVVSPDLAKYWSSGGLSDLFKTPKFQKTAVSGYLGSSANKAPKTAYNANGRGFPGESANLTSRNDCFLTTFRPSLSSFHPDL